jgi:hypothetical protein
VTAKCNHFAPSNTVYAVVRSKIDEIFYYIQISIEKRLIFGFCLLKCIYAFDGTTYQDRNPIPSELLFGKEIVTTFNCLTET